MQVALWRGRTSFALTLIAVAYSVAFLVWAISISAIDGQTLLDYGGPASLGIVVQPLLASLLMWFLLRRRCTTGSDVATTRAWALGTAFLVWSVLGALSLAAGSFPAAALLMLALLLTPRPAQRLS